MPDTTRRVVMVTVTTHTGTYPDPGALAGAVERILRDPGRGLAVPAVQAVEVVTVHPS